VNPLTPWIGTAATALWTVTWLLVVGFYFWRTEQPGRRAIRAYQTALEAKLRFLRLRAPASRMVVGQLVVGLMVGACGLLQNSPVPLILFPIIGFAPKFRLDMLVAKRVADIEAQIEPWLVAVANALKASPSLGEAVASSATLLPAPMSEEIDLLVKEYELGTSLDRALEQFAERICSKTLSGAVLALQVARNSGGNLPEMLENASAALRELARLEGVVRTKTAEGKAQAFVIGAIPLPMVAGIHWMDNHFFDPLFTTFAGKLVIGVAVALWATAILLATKILAVDV
jgi:tight adherence protein B